jgi:trehalose-6-phosphate synthase
MVVEQVTVGAQEEEVLVQVHRLDTWQGQARKIRAIKEAAEQHLMQHTTLLEVVVEVQDLMEQQQPLQGEATGVMAG